MCLPFYKIDTFIVAGAPSGSLLSNLYGTVFRFGAFETITGKALRGMDIFFIYSVCNTPPRAGICFDS